MHHPVPGTLTDPQPRVQFAAELTALEHQLTAKMTALRERFKHSGDKGATAEAAFREALRSYLPRRLEVGQGEVIDTLGLRSAQTDVVIANEDHPFTFTPDAPGLFFIEGVVAAGEVKSVLTTSELAGSIKSARRFKQLKSVFGPETTVKSNPSDLPRFVDSRPYFLFAFESEVTSETVLERLREAAQEGDRSGLDFLDAVFVLGRGPIFNLGDGKGSFKVADDNLQSATGFKYSDKGGAMIALLGWLSVVMPRVRGYESIMAYYLMPRTGSSGEWARAYAQLSTRPKGVSQSQVINDGRRQQKADEAAFFQKHGRKPTRKELKRLGGRGQ